MADVDQDCALEVVISLKDAEDGVRQVLVCTIPGSGTRCSPWPAGRGNLERNGLVLR